MADLSAHIDEWERSEKRSDDRWRQADLDRHQLRNDMLAALAEIRLSITADRVQITAAMAALTLIVGSNAAAVSTRVITIAGAVIMILIASLAYMIAKNGL